MTYHFAPDGINFALDKEFLFSPEETPRQLSEPTLSRDALESDMFKAVHAELLATWTAEVSRQAVERAEMMLDEQFYDGKQFNADELAILQARGQMPLVYNVLATTVNYMLGTYRRNPREFRLLPRRKEGLKAANTKTELLKYVSDTSNSPHVYQRAFRDCVRAGIGWLETGYRTDYDREPVYEGWESWRNVFWDSASQKDDMSDGRYLFRHRWTDLDSAVARFPTRRDMLMESCDNVYGELFNAGLNTANDIAMDTAERNYWDNSSYVYSNGTVNRRRLRLIEAWYRRTVPSVTVQGGEFSGEIYDPWSRGHYKTLTEGSAQLFKRPKQIMHVAIMTPMGLCYHGPTPYRHNRFPLTPIWANRDADTNMPYGFMRQLRDIQRDINKRASKAQHILSSSRVFTPKGAVDDIEELRDEVARPDAVIEYDPTAGAPTVETDQNLASAHIDLMSRNIEMVQSIGGITNENLGRETNAVSGKAIIARQTEGQTTTYLYFDNERSARLAHGEKVLSVVEQFYTDEKEFRITGNKPVPEWLSINNPDDPESDITQSKADYIIEEIDFNATVRQANAEMLFDVLSKLATAAPELVINTMDLLISSLDVPHRDEIVERIRALNGQDDPDADPENPTPEEQERIKGKEAMAQQQAIAADLEMRGAEAKVRLDDAKALETETKAKTALKGLEGTVLDNLKKAIEAAVEVAGAPAMAAAADLIMAEAAAEVEEPATPQQMPDEQPIIPA